MSVKLSNEDGAALMAAVVAHSPYRRALAPMLPDITRIALANNQIRSCLSAVSERSDFAATGVLAKRDLGPQRAEQVESALLLTRGGGAYHCVRGEEGQLGAGLVVAAEAAEVHGVGEVGEDGGQVEVLADEREAVHATSLWRGGAVRRELERVSGSRREVR